MLNYLWTRSSVFLETRNQRPLEKNSVKKLDNLTQCSNANAFSSADSLVSLTVDLLNNSETLS